MKNKYFMSTQKSHRVVLIGDSLVGKSSIVSSILSFRSDLDIRNTVGAVFHTFNNIINGKEVSLMLCDTAGQEQYRSLGPIYYRNAAGALAVFDLTSKQSSMSLKEWISIFRESTDNAFVVIVANKHDLTDKWEVTMDEAVKEAEELESDVFFTSAKNNHGIEELFQSIFERIASLCNPIDQARTYPVPKAQSSCC